MSENKSSASSGHKSIAERLQSFGSERRPVWTQDPTPIRIPELGSSYCKGRFASYLMERQPITFDDFKSSLVRAMQDQMPQVVDSIAEVLAKLDSSTYRKSAAMKISKGAVERLPQLLTDVIQSLSIELLRRGKATTLNRTTSYPSPPDSSSETPPSALKQSPPPVPTVLTPDYSRPVEQERRAKVNRTTNDRPDLTPLSMVERLSSVTHSKAELPSGSCEEGGKTAVSLSPRMPELAQSRMDAKEGSSQGSSSKAVPKKERPPMPMPQCVVRHLKELEEERQARENSTPRYNPSASASRLVERGASTMRTEINLPSSIRSKNDKINTSLLSLSSPQRLLDKTRVFTQGPPQKSSPDVVPTDLPTSAQKRPAPVENTIPVRRDLPTPATILPLHKLPEVQLNLLDMPPRPRPVTQVLPYNSTSAIPKTPAETSTSTSQPKHKEGPPVRKKHKPSAVNDTEFLTVPLTKVGPPTRRKRTCRTAAPAPMPRPNLSTHLPIYVRQANLGIGITYRRLPSPPLAIRSPS
ncbi:hypothetical protein BXZ70DRAFT_937656 [Cristinia sonorae]|uniref:Uncharacterized protein n=1 Tax=Cristinia sonorae TaxID=1940300 RepID=A0A8K0XPN2_9AGAR|nr:hypothetical protein BXZ70DRAFT_937656 [Cristinia sonorae]